MSAVRALPWLVAALVAALATIVFWQALSAPLFLDDVYRIVDNPALRGTVPWWRHFVDPHTSTPLDRIVQYRPLLPLTLSWNWAVHGLAPRGYHVVNLVLHLVSAGLIVALGHRLIGTAQGERRSLTIATGLAATAFVLHPTAALVVGYASARDLALALPLLLGTLLVAIRATHSSGARFGGLATLVSLLTVLALMAKTNAATLPVLVLLMTWATGARGWRPLAVAGASLIAVAGFFLWTRLGLGFSDWANVVDSEVSWWESLKTQLAVHGRAYLPHFLWPSGLVWLPDAPEGSLGNSLTGALGIAFSLVWALLRRKSAPAIAACVLAYWILIAPESSLIPFHHARVDYRPYPAAPFLLLALAGEAIRLSEAWQRRTLGLGIAWLVALGIFSVQTSRMYTSEREIWRRSAEAGGDSTALMNYAVSLRGYDEEAARRAFEATIAKTPRHVLAHVNFGLFLIDHGERPRGLEELRTAVQQAPGWAQPWYWWSIGARRVGDNAVALEGARRAAELDPTTDRYRYQAARELVMAKDYAEALPHLAALATIAGRYEDAAYLEGYAHQMLGNTDAATAAYETQLAADPKHAVTLFNLGYLLMKSGRCDAAVPYLERALEVDPASAGARSGLATCHAAPK